MSLISRDIGPVPVGDNLEITVSNLLKRLPEGSNAFLITLCDSRLVGVNKGVVKGILINFVSFGFDGLREGTFVLSYSYKDESAKQGNVGRDHGDPVDNVLKSID